MAPVSLPPPATGSFTTVFDFLPDGRIVAFDGFTVFVQAAIDSSSLVPIGTLPPAFKGGADPAFVVVSRDGQDIVLGAGAGGSKFPDPNFNGNMFLLTPAGGQATLIGRFPFHIEATFRKDHQLVFGEGETFGTFTGSVELLDLDSSRRATLVSRTLGDPSGVVFDREGNLFVGLGAGQTLSRTGEIHRYDHDAIARAIASHTPVDWNTGGRLITQILSGSSLHFGKDREEQLFVGGGDIVGTTGSFGFFAEINAETGAVVQLFEPEDNDPNGHDLAFWELSFTKVGCRLAAVNTFTSGSAPVFQIKVCNED